MWIACGGRTHFEKNEHGSLDVIVSDTLEVVRYFMSQLGLFSQVGEDFVALSLDSLIGEFTGLGLGGGGGESCYRWLRIVAICQIWYQK